MYFFPFVSVIINTIVDGDKIHYRSSCGAYDEQFPIGTNPWLSIAKFLLRQKGCIVVKKSPVKIVDLELADTDTVEFCHCVNVAKFIVNSSTYYMCNRSQL